MGLGVWQVRARMALLHGRRRVSRSWPQLRTALRRTRAGAARRRAGGADADCRRRANARCSWSPRRGSASARRATSPTTSESESLKQSRGWPSWSTRASWFQCGSRDGSSPRSFMRRPESPGECRRAHCCHRSTRWCGSGNGRSVSSPCAIGSSCTRLPPNACMATTCCRSCSMTRSSRGSISRPTARDRGFSSLGVHLEQPHVEPSRTKTVIGELEAELRSMADWLELERISPARVRL